MKKFNIFLLTLSIVLILSASIYGAIAYFTTYAEALSTKIPLKLGEYRTENSEAFFSWTKALEVTNTVDIPIFVRARAFAGSQYELQYDSDVKDHDGNYGYWVYGGDGYYYYSITDSNNIGYPLYKDEKTALLNIHIDNIPESLQGGESFNVVVIYEYTPAQYDDDGKALADWSLSLKYEEGGEN